jgi:NAD-dependent dihydropyrimidine dehydrogenase PreA subunit/DNA-binding transcriptional ArsR family regulator
MSNQEAYEHFVQWLGRAYWELPDSEHLMPLIRAHYSAEEAALLTGMPFSGKTVEELAAKKGLDPAELGPKLKELSRKGMVYESVKGDSVRYRLNDSMFAMLRANLWPGRTDDKTKATAPLINKYYLDGWGDQWDQTHPKGLRAIPIDQTIKDTRETMAFEDVVQVVEDREYYTVTTCPCRHRHNLDPDMPDCNHPDEVCLHFDELGRYVVENGMGREITKEETLEILRKSADSGLVHGLSNWQDKPDTICNCCSCCCLMLETYHKLGHDRSLEASNYIVEVDASTCKGCALCVKRCPMDALQLRVSAEAKNKVGKVAVLEPDACIGCGVCAHKCPGDSLTLVRKDEITEPPETSREWAERFVTARRALQSQGEPTTQP